MEVEPEDIIIQLQSKIRKHRMFILILIFVCWILCSTIILLLMYEHFALKSTERYLSNFVIFVACSIVILLNISYIGYHLIRGNGYHWHVSAHIVTYIVCYVIIGVILFNSSHIFKNFAVFAFCGVTLFGILFTINFIMFKMFEIIDRIKEEEFKQIPTVHSFSRSGSHAHRKSIHIRLFEKQVNAGAGPSGKCIISQEK